jgi:hypothetical protein
MQEFFKELELDITEICDMEKYILRANKGFIEGYLSNRSVIESLKQSFIFEGAEFTDEQLQNIIESDNDIVKLHNIIEPNKLCKRTFFVGIPGPTAWYNGKWIHLGMEDTKINIERLQKWVDLYHSFQFNSPGEKLIVGFILYLLYERIHPHEDGNGRMGRYLFIENKLSYFPFNYDTRVNLYSETSFKGYVGEFNYNIRYKPESDYYKLVIGNKLMEKIIEVIEQK